MDEGAVAVPLDADDGGVPDELHAVGLQMALDDRRGIPVLARQDVVTGLEERHLGAETLEGLRHLAADRARPDDHQARGKCGQPEERLVSEVLDLVEAGDGRGGSAGARRDHRARELECPAVDLDRRPAREAGVSEVDVDAETGEALDAVVGREAGPEPAHALHDGRKVHLDAVDPHAVVTGRPRLGGRAGGADERLGGHAPDVQAVAPEEVALHERHLGAQPGAARRGHQTRRAPAEHDEVVAAARDGVRAPARVHMRQEDAVVLIVREYEGPVGAQRRGD